MKDIIEAIDKSLIKNELTEDKFLRNSNLGKTQLFVVDYYDSPNIMKEVGRLREITFRSAGGGTGKECDIDEFDTCSNPYKQLIVWDPKDQEILGGYRFKVCGENKPEDDLQIATTHLFNFSEKFIKEYLPHTIELGRSFVRTDYQATSDARKAIYTLDNLFNGLGAITVNSPTKKYYFGKVTVYADYNEKARDLLIYFLNLYFKDKEGLMETKNELVIEDLREGKELFTGKNFKEDYRALNKRIREYGESIPPLINSYVNLSPSMKVFGTGINNYFGDVIETGILITIEDIYNEKADRHIQTTHNELNKWEFG